MEIIANIGEYLTNFLSSLGIWGAVLGCVFILFESILPPVPLSLFITLNFMTFGSLLGFIISWIFTCLGCIMSYYIFRKGVSEKQLEKLKKNEKFNKILKKINGMSLASLMILIAIPFTPAFLVNIAAGISRINPKKFIISILIGKISLVYFCGYVGVSLLEAFSNPIIFIRIIVILIVVYLLSTFLSKKFKID